MIRESRVAWYSPDGEQAAVAARKREGTVMARTITVTIEKPDGNEEVVVTVDDPVAEDDNKLDIVEYYKRRLPLTVKAMGL